MRVRQWAVVGAAAAVAWVGGAGIASATPVEGTEGACLPPLAAVSVSEGETEGELIADEPCGEPTARAIAEVGCSGPGVLELRVTGLEPGEEVTLVLDPGTGTTSRAYTDGTLDLFGSYDPATEVVGYELEDADGEVLISDHEDVVNTCDGSAELVVTGDCLDPETLFLSLDVTGLEPLTEYGVDYQSAGFVLNPGVSGNAVFFDTITTDAVGAASIRTEATEDEDISINPGSFTVDYAIYGLDSNTTSVEGSALAEACPVEEETHPTPTDTTPAGHPVTTPVVVQPVAQHPAVLANTGTPTATLALLGGGLLVAGAGALVVTRRRA